jgi:hypothetical protein
MSLENSGHALSYHEIKKEYTADKEIMLATVEIQRDFALNYIDNTLKNKE